MLFGLGGDAVSMAGAVGADDKNLFAGKHRFKILGDRKVLWDSGVMQGDAARAFDVDLSGLDKVPAAGRGGRRRDHVRPCRLAGGEDHHAREVEPLPVWARPISKGKYILTPASPETPQINNPLVYGARPGNPFLMPVMASGKRPMAYGGAGLRAGLDPPLQADNGPCARRRGFQGAADSGECPRESRTGDIAENRAQIALTRPCWKQLELFWGEVRMPARAMHEKLLAYGWTYVNIDDGWPADTRSADGRLLPNEKFPDFKGLSDYVHSLGLKLASTSSPGPTTCGNYPGSYRHELTDARTWATNGVWITSKHTIAATCKSKGTPRKDDPGTPTWSCARRWIRSTGDDRLLRGLRGSQRVELGRRSRRQPVAYDPRHHR